MGFDAQTRTWAHQITRQEVREWLRSYGLSRTGRLKAAQRIHLPIPMERPDLVEEVRRYLEADR